MPALTEAQLIELLKSPEVREAIGKIAARYVADKIARRNMEGFLDVFMTNPGGPRWATGPNDADPFRPSQIIEQLTRHSDRLLDQAFGPGAAERFNSEVESIDLGSPRQCS